MPPNISKADAVCFNEYADYLDALRDHQKLEAFSAG